MSTMTAHAEGIEFNPNYLVPLGTTDIKIRDTRKRRKCAECGGPIRKRDLEVVVDGRDVHTLCAGTEGKLEPCPNCFMVLTSCSC